MQIDGKRVKEVKWIHGHRCVVRLEVDAVIPVDDPSEPCFEPETVKWLAEVRRRADAGDVEWLKGVGEVYVRYGERHPV